MLGDLSPLVKLKILILTVLITIVLPFIAIIFIPIYIQRYVTNVLKGLLRPDLGPLIPAPSALFAVEDICNKPLATLVVLNTFQGQLTLEDLRRNFRKRLLSKGHDGRLECIFPELLQFPSTWMGFPVWKSETTFSLEKHIRLYDGPVTFDSFTESVTFNVLLELAKRPYTSGKSPWEIYVFENYQVTGDPNPEIPKSAIMLRIHHCLADGFSLVKLFTAIGNGKIVTPTPNYSKSSSTSKCLDVFTFMVQIPYNLAILAVLGVDSIGPWHWPKSSLANDSACSVTPNIPLTYIKTIRDANRATTTGIIMTAVAGALRRIMIDSGKGMPESIVLVTTFPIPGHPEKLGNHMAAVPLSFPVGTENPVERLRIIEQNMKSVRNSMLPTFMFCLTKIFGALYPPMTRFLAHQGLYSMIFSNFPGPTPQTRFINLPVLDSIFFGSFTQGIGMAACSISSNGNLRIALGINDAILPNGETYVKRFGEYIFLELDALSIKAKGTEIDFENLEISKSKHE